MAPISLWLILLITSIVIWIGLVFTRKIGENDRKKAIILGIALAVFDFIFESIGAMTDLWTTSGSIFSLGAVPVEVAIIAFFAGFVYSIILPKNLNMKLGLLFTFIIAVAGASIELVLLSNGLVSYSGWWSSYHAVVSYFIVFYGLYKLNSMIKL